MLSTIYFMGLVMFAIAVAKYTDMTPYGFMIVGGGMILYAMVVGMWQFLYKRKR